MYERLDILKEVENILLERQEKYGKLENSFEKISGLWSGALDKKIPQSQAALLMALMKIGRIQNNTSVKDSFIDAIGYIALAYELSLQEAKLEPDT